MFIRATEFHVYELICIMSIPVAVRSKAYVCGRLIAEIAVSNPAESMHVFVV
jgi:hypothetical protein